MTDNKAPADPLDVLAKQAESLSSGTDPTGAPGETGQTAEEAQQAAQAMAVIEAGAIAVVTGLLKIARAFIAKRLPEIRDEWTDDAFQAPAAAAVPLLRRHFARLMEIAGSSPEAAALAMSCLPLAFGLISAIDKANEREKKEAANGDAGAPGLTIVAG